MKTITFYSYKGGSGRTLAATNFAVYLAKLGLKVVIIDFDLDAPGVDSKFPGFELPSEQLGLMDYILKFQRHGGAPGPVKDIFCHVAISSHPQEYSLGIIPAGDYLADDYSAKLNELDWSLIFSELDGVAFFQLFLKRIQEELNPQVLIIDSRTGFSEIGGLCTQQLADETVMLSSMAGESIKMTRHLSRLIRDSEISRKLDKKEVETKIVVSRVPKPPEIDKLKAECCKKFDVDDANLFFLFSCPELEREEFVAMLDTEKENALVANYIQLFQGLDVQVAKESIQEEIEKVERGLLSGSKEEAESRIREMAALYPDPEVYRTAMRFFDLKERGEEVAVFASKLLDLRPNDDEAIAKLSQFFLHREHKIGRMPLSRTHPQLAEVTDIGRLVSISKRAYSADMLSIDESVRLADLLEDVDDPQSSFDVAMACIESEQLEKTQFRTFVMVIAARTAMQLGKQDVVEELVSQIPVSRLPGSLADVAIRMRAEKEGDAEAFELAKLIVAQGVSSHAVSTAAELASKLGKVGEFQEFIREAREENDWPPQMRREIDRYVHGFEELSDRDISPHVRRARRREN